MPLFSWRASIAGVLETAHGGPYDGAELSPSIPAEFVWVDGRKCFLKRGKGRSLYRRVHNRFGDRVLIFVGYVYAVCQGCGAYHRCRETDTCSLCGGKLG